MKNENRPKSLLFVGWLVVLKLWKQYGKFIQHWHANSEQQWKVHLTVPWRGRHSGPSTNSSQALYFLADLACMKDILRELDSLSLTLQQKETSLVDARCHIQALLPFVSSWIKAGHWPSTSWVTGRESKRQKTPGPCGRLWFKVRIRELLAWAMC